MKIAKTEFVGTPDEFKSVAYLFKDGVDISQSEVNSEKIEPKDAYRAMLRRRFIHDGQKSVYKTLAKGELEFSEYQRRLGRTSDQIAGVHGALGKRIKNTPEIIQAGLPGDMDAVRIWRHENGKDYISLKSEFIEVLREEGIVD